MKTLYWWMSRITFSTCRSENMMRTIEKVFWSTLFEVGTIVCWNMVVMKTLDGINIKTLIIMLFFILQRYETMFCFIHSALFDNFLIFDIDWKRIIYFKFFRLVENSSFSTIDLEIKWLIKCYWVIFFFFESELVDCFFVLYFASEVHFILIFKNYKDKKKL